MHPERLAAKQRTELIRREQQAARDLIAYYGEALHRVERELQRVRDLIDEAPSPALLRRDARLTLFEQQTRRHLTDFALQAAQRIARLQGDAVGQAVADLPPMLKASLGPGPRVEFAPPPPSVPLSVVGLSADGGPLAAVLTERAGEAAALARQELVVGVIRGQGPRQIARNVSRVSGMAYNRALLVARTESIRAYRVTTLEGFRANPAVVQQWTWQCTYDVRTCAACWAMSGTVHPVDEMLNSHPGCRCSMLPRTASYQDLGFDGVPDSRPTVRVGTDVFDALSAAEQRAILGPGKYAAYTEGRITLPDLVQRTRSARWGPGRREKSLAAALA